MLFLLLQFLSFHLSFVRSQSSSLLVFAEASSFARLDEIDPSGWFYQAVLYNPTDSNIAVTGLRWWYNASETFIAGLRDATCYDSRYLPDLPTTWVSEDDDATKWEYAPGDINIIVPPKSIIVTWIEVPTYSVNNDGILATYYVEAYVNEQWLSSPLYVSHSGHDNAASTVFRADFNLTTNPNDEQQTHPNPEWLFNEDRLVIANLSTRVRIIPVTSSRNSDGIDYADIYVTLPLGWRYVPGTAYNPYNETITYHFVDGKDRLQWNLDKDVIVYSQNQSIAQNYIEFNVTAPNVPGVHNFTITSIITSLNARTTIENQSIYAVVKTPPNATFTYSPTAPLTDENVTFNAAASYDFDGQIVNYFWDFGDGNTGTGNVTVHSYADNGTYTVTLTITDNDGLNSTASDTIVVQNRPPVASFTESAEIVDTNVVIHFNASESYDPDGSIVSYYWDFGDGTNATGMIVNHTYPDNGNYTVKLTVTDDDGASAIATDVKTILNRAPVASFVTVPQQPIVGEAIIFNASDSYDSDGEIVSYRWDFGDNNITTVSSPTIIHRYASSGNYIVTLTITDNDDSYDSSTLTLTVHNIDVAIVDMMVSTDEVYLGQSVDITVIVKNEGTIDTTFKVTLYANNTAIGVLIINDLQPNQTKNLVFTWNTSNFTESGTYKVKAEIDEISGETDVTDNSNESVYVTIHSRPSNLWDKLNSYSIPISLGLVFLLLSAIAGTILIKRNKQAEALKTLPPQEIGIFDALAGGDISGVSVMIVGDAGSGKSVLCQQLVNTYLKQGKPCIYITYDCFPNEIRENMKALGWDTSEYEQNETFLFIDCYSSIAGVPSREKHNVKQPFALSELGIAMSTTIENLKQKSTRIFLDSTVPLFTRLNPAKVVEFLQDRSAQIKGENGVFLFTIGKETVEHGLIRRLEEIVDCIIELEVHEEKGEPKRKMRIKKLRGRNFINEWISFKIEQKKGLVLSIPKKWIRKKK